MRNLKNVLLMLIPFCVLLTAAPASAETRIAVIRAAELVRESPLYKNAETKMKAEFEKRQNELVEQRRKLDEDIKKFQKESDIMSADARAKAEKELNTRQIDFGYSQRKFQEDFAARERELTQGLMSRIRDVINDVAKEKGYDLILQDPVYAAAGLDITDEVLKRLSQTPEKSETPSKGKSKK